VIGRLLRSTWARGLITAAILAWMATRIDMAAALRALVTVHPLAVAAVLALVAFDRLVMIWRWVSLLRATGAPVDTPTAARIFLVSSFVGGFLPAGVGGDAARAWALSRHTDRRSEAVASVAVDRVLGVVALALLGGLGALLWSTRVPPELRQWVYAAAGACLVASGLALWADVLAAWLLRGPLRHQWVGRMTWRLAEAMGEYRSQPRVLLGVLGLSVLVQVLRVLQAWGLGLGLGLDVPLTYYFVFMPIGLLMLLLPISVSGFGVPQGIIVWLLRPVGVDPATAFALSTLIVLSGIAGNLPGAWLYLRPRAR
jgi:uncharacterized membrane protein YbhN (UPF0104 family)